MTIGFSATGDAAKLDFESAVNGISLDEMLYLSLMAQAHCPDRQPSLAGTVHWYFCKLNTPSSE